MASNPDGKAPPRDDLGASSTEDPGQIETGLEYKNDLHKGRSADSVIEKGAKSKFGLDYAVNFKFLSSINEKIRHFPVSSSECAKYVHVCKRSQQFLMQMKNIQTEVEAVYNEKDCTVKIQFSCLCKLEDNMSFQKWEKNCSDIISECVEDTEFVTVEVSERNWKKVEEFINSDDAVKRKEIKVTEAQHTSGFCLLGHGEDVFDIIDRLFQNFEQMQLIDPETNQELCIACVGVEERFLCIANAFREINFELPIDKIPNMKKYYKEKEVKLIGNAIDMQEAIIATKNMQWLEALCKEDLQLKKEVMSFLLRPNVEAYIDEVLAKGGLGSWLVLIPQQQDEKIVRLYSTTEDNLAQLKTFFESSFYLKEILISKPDKFATSLSSWRSTAKQLEKDVGARFFMSEHQTADSGLKLLLMFTADLSSSRSVQDFIGELRAAEESVEESEFEIDINPMLYRYICKYKIELVQEVANNEKLDVQFRDAEHRIVVKGSDCAIEFFKAYMEKFHLSKKCIILPKGIVESTTEKFFQRYECISEVCSLGNNSQIQLLGEGSVIMVCCFETIDDLHVDITLNMSTVSQGWDFQGLNYTHFEGSRTTVDVQIPEYSDKDKEQHKVHEIFQTIFTKMMQTKKRSLHIPMQNTGKWPVRKFVKCVLFSLQGLSQQKSFEVIFSDKDQRRCSKMNYGLNEALNGATQKKQLIELDVVKGEIAKTAVDVIINTTSTDFNLSLGAVSSSIMKEAKGNMQLDLKGKTANFGEILVTDSYRLKCKKVFHGALKSWPVKSNPDEEKDCLKVLRQFVTNCLSKASELKYSSIAFPAIGTGRIRIPPEEVVKHIRDAIQTFMDKNLQGNLKKITFIIYHRDEETFTTFKKLEGELTRGTASDRGDWEEVKNLVLWGEADMLEKAAEAVEDIFIAEVKKRCSTVKDVVKDYPKEPTSPEILDRGGPTQNEVKKSMKKEVYEEPSKPSAVKADAEKCCVIVTFKSPSFKMPLHEIPILKRIKPRTIVFPFTAKNVAMVVFETPTDAEQAFIHAKDFGSDADLSYLAKQAVSNVQAQVSEKFLELFGDKEKLHKGVTSRSGVKVQMMENGKWILCGYLTQIDLAHKYLKEEYKRLKEAKIKGSTAESIASESASHLQKTKTKTPLENDAEQHGQNSTIYSLEPQNKASVNKPDKKFPEEVKELNKSPSLKQQEKMLTKSIPMSESKYLKFLQVFPELQSKTEHENESMVYNQEKLTLCGSRSFVQDVCSQIDMMETEMTEKTIVFEMKEEYHAALQDLKTQKQEDKFNFYFHRDDANFKLTLFGFSRECVERGLFAVKKFQKPTSKPVKEEKNESVLTFITNGLKVKFYTGSIIGLDVDCIVSSATFRLENKSGIAKAIADKAGKKYRRDCENCVSHLSGGRLNEGQCCVTSAGDLSYKHVIHVIGPIWTSGSSGMDDQSNILKQAVLSVLIKADEMQMKSVAIPAISAGQKSADKRLCAEIYAKTVIDFSKAAMKRKFLEEVHFVDANEAMVNMIAQTFQKVIDSKTEGTLPQKVHGAEGGHTPQRPLPFRPKSEKLKPEGFKSFVHQFHLKKHFKVKLYEGNILNGEVDAICCGQDIAFKSNGNIAKEIVKKWQEVESKIKSIKKGRINMEDVFTVECNDKKIILFVVTRFLTKQNSNEQSVLRSIEACMKKLLCTAEESGIQKLALPLLGTGNKGAPKGKVISIWYHSIMSFLKESSKGKTDGLREVHFISKDENDIGEISSLFNNYVDNYSVMGETYV